MAPKILAFPKDPPNYDNRATPVLNPQPLNVHFPDANSNSGVFEEVNDIDDVDCDGRTHSLPYRTIDRTRVRLGSALPFWLTRL